jgi:hypothetical protein
LKYGSWVTHTWLQSLWEKVDKFDITVEIAPLPMEPPQEDEKWFMQAVVEADLTSAQEMKILNCFRCHPEVIYLSDMFDAGGRCLDGRYLDHQKQDEKWLTLIFPQEKSPQGGHLQLWRECLYSLAPRRRPTERVGAFKSKGYKIWDWQYDNKASKVYHHNGHVMDIYTPSLVPGYTRCPKCWTRSQISVPLEEKGEYCTVKQVSLGVYTVVLHTPRPQAMMEPTAFWDVIKSWGNTWIWDNLRITGDTLWIVEAIADNSLVTITDGSYMKELYPNLNSAALVFECTKGWGVFWDPLSNTQRTRAAIVGNFLV